VAQCEKLLSVQFIATWKFTVAEDVQNVDGKISNTDVPVLYQTNLLHATVDAAKLNLSAIRSNRFTSKKYSTCKLK